MDSTGGLFTNVGGGLGRWIKPRTISGGIIIGIDTFYVSSGVDSAYIDIFPIDSSGFELVKSNGKRDTVIFTGIGGGGGGGFDTTTIYLELNQRVKYSDTAAMLDPYKESYISYRSITEGIELLRIDGTKDTIPISSSNFPTVDDTLKANRQLFIDTYNLLFKSQNNNLFTLNNTGLSYTGSNWSNSINASYQEYLQGFGNEYSMLRLQSGVGRIYSQSSGTIYSMVQVSPDMINLRGYDSIVVSRGINQVALDTTARVMMQLSNGKLVKVNPSEFSGGGGGTADTVFTKFPIVVDTAGVKDTLKLKYPPNSVAVNLTNDTADVQFLTISSFRHKLLGYREYVALLYYSPSPTDTIIAEVIHNDLGFDIDWLYDDVGNYSASYVGGTADINKVSISFSSNATGFSNAGGSSYHTMASVSSTSGFTVFTRALQLTPSPEFVAVNSILQKNGDDGSTFITIRIYN